MRQAPANVLNVVEPVVESLGYELVGVEYLAQGHDGLLRVYIDAEDGIKVEDCQRVSHQLSGVLDVEDVIKGHYSLEISSPGLNRPLFSAAHFERFAGAEVKLRLDAPLDGRRKFCGVLVGVQDGDVRLLVDGEEVRVPLASIDKANLVAQF
ncbi:Bacterial ribosome SSU maturation protein RimP [hydrothermal vent metagenome]|uniref:Bacterial ribosome SSU maturation protein RimP n=1 Tax=hydrothermal vent metagenome TaxID=652676 RepID=A0A3B1ARM1_9ZZZZ